MNMPKLNVVNVYTVNRKDVHGLMVVIDPVDGVDSVDLHGANVDFSMPNGQVLEYSIDTVLSFNNQWHCFFPQLSKIYKPICFSDPEEDTITIDTNSVS